MEGYPYIQKVSSPYAAFPETASHPDKSTNMNGGFEQPVYEQLMPSTLVAVNPYCYDASATAACNNVESSIMVPDTTASTGTFNLDPYSVSVVGTNGSLSTHSLPSEQTPLYVAPVVNDPHQAGDLMNESDKQSFPDVESTVRIGADGDHVNDNRITVEPCLTTLPEQTTDCKLKVDDQIVVPPNEKRTISTKEVNVNEPCKPKESIEVHDSEIVTNSQHEAGAISNDTFAKEDKLESDSKHSESDNTNQEAAPTTVEEKHVDSNLDEDESSNDSAKSDSCTEALHSDNVSSLFKNVVLVQAHTLTVEENDAIGRVSSAAEKHALNEAEPVDPIVTSSVEDIGREDEPMEHEMLDPAGLLIDETGDVQNFEIMEGVAVGQMGQIVALDAPIIDPNDIMEEPDNDTNGDCSGKENASKVSIRKSKQLDTVSLSSDEETTSQKCQMRKRGVVRIVNVEKELLNRKQKRSKLAKGGASNDDPFGSCASSSSEDVPNDMYFGAPDRVFTVSTKLHWQRQKQKSSKYYARAKATDRYDDASSESDEEELTQRRAKKAEEIARLKLPAYQQQQLQQLVLKKHPKRDRFYDRSQDIPNDIYFGNVKVPLHILHATSSSSSDEEPWPGGSVKSATSSNYRKESTTYTTKSSNNRYSRSSSSRAESASTQGSVRSVHRMKEYLKMAGFRHMRYQKLWHGCETNHDRAEAILRFLQAHGLQGEPTDEKCRELRKQIQLQKEVEVLDTSVIIGSGEGRVTRQRAKKVPETTVVEPSEPNHSAEPSLQKEEQTLESAAAVAATETTEVETECVQEQQVLQQERVENVPLENHVEHGNSSNSLPNE